MSSIKNLAGPRSQFKRYFILILIPVTALLGLFSFYIYRTACQRLLARDESNAEKRTGIPPKKKSDIRPWSRRFLPGPKAMPLHRQTRGRVKNSAAPQAAAQPDTPETKIHKKRGCRRKQHHRGGKTRNSGAVAERQYVMQGIRNPQKEPL